MSMSLPVIKRGESQLSTADTDPEKTHRSAPPFASELAPFGEDEGDVVLAAHKNDTPATAEELKLTLRKIDFVVMPFMWVIYALNYTDKSAFSTAINFGMAGDLDLFYKDANGKTNTGRYSNTTTIYYVGFVTGVPILALCAQRYPTAKVCAMAVTAWGLVCMATAWCHSYPAAMVQRFFLGFCEAGVQPCFVLLLGAWYTKIMRHAFWWSGAGGSVPISTAINYGLLHAPGSLSPWRYIFYFWGAVTVACGIFLLFALPDSPVNAWMLSSRQKFIAVERLRINQSGVENRHFKREQFIEAITDPRVIALGIMQFGVSTTNALTSAFSQILFKNLLHTSAYRAMVLNIPGGVVSAVIVLSVGNIGVRARNCVGLLSIISQLMVVVGAILLWVAPPTNEAALFVGIYFMAFFIGAVCCNFAFASANVAGHTKKTVAAAWMILGTNAGNAAAPKFFLPTAAPSYTSGFIAIAVCVIGTTVITALYTYSSWRENTRRDALGEEGKIDRAFRDLTDKQNLTFRYIL